MKKTLLLLLIFTFHFSPFTSWSQGRFDASVFGGLNMCQIDGDDAGSYGHPGLRFGVGTSFPLSDDLQSPWRMVVELAFTNKGSYIEDYDRTLSASYIELPLMISYTGMDNRLRLAAGVAPAVRVGASVTTYGIEDPVTADNFTDFDWLPLTVTIRYRFSKHLGLEGRYQNSMVSVTKNFAAGTYRLFRSNKGCFHNLVSIGLSYQF